MARPFLTAAWRDLAMLNWEVDPAVLRGRVPAGTELDSWNGRTWVSVVGFLFLDTRIAGLPVPGHRDFEEINLRFYVRRGEKRGVTFVKEIVPKRAIAWVARTLYNEPYVRHRTAHRVTPQRVEYRWRRAVWESVAASRSGAPSPLAPGSHEEFIAEHYWGYCAQRGGGTLEYRVEHPPWRVWTASDAAIDLDGRTLYGEEFAFLNRRPPDTAFVAEGSPVSVWRGVRL
jgi:uncharacterized protein YqjF (DUF2071 family)